MSNLKVGMNVVRVENPLKHPKGIQGVSPKFPKGVIHKVKSVCYCSQCGRQKIDIGLSIPPIINDPTIRCSCGFNYFSQGKWFVDAINFRPVQYENISVEIVEKLKITEEKSDLKPIEIEEHEKI